MSIRRCNVDPEGLAYDTPVGEFVRFEDVPTLDELGERARSLGGNCPSCLTGPVRRMTGGPLHPQCEHDVVVRMPYREAVLLGAIERETRRLIEVLREAVADPANGNVIPGYQRVLDVLGMLGASSLLNALDDVRKRPKT